MVAKTLKKRIHKGTAAVLYLFGTRLAFIHFRRQSTAWWDPLVAITPQGFEGGEGQETRLFPLTWVRGPSGKLLPRYLPR